jgi:prevent-host-death family protein
MDMPRIRPISDLRNKANDISEFCRESREPVYITKNGIGDMVIMSIETYERQKALIDLYTKLAEAEEEIVNGLEGEDFIEVARQLKKTVHGQI